MSKPRYNNLLKILFTGVVLFFAFTPSVQAQNTCATLFDSQYGDLKKTFKHSDEYTVLLESPSDIKNQCTLGTCHLYAWSTNLEALYLKNHGAIINISTDHLSAMHWRKTVLDLIEAETKDNETAQLNISLGSVALASKNLIKSYGIIPLEVWQPKAGFNLQATTSKVNAYAKNIIGKARVEIENATDAEQKQKIVEQTRKVLSQMLDNVIGVPPERFNYQGREYTPNSFQERFFPEVSNPITQYLVSSDRKATTKVTKDTAEIKTTTVNLDEVEMKLKEAVDAEHMIYLAYMHDHNFVDKKTGIMSIAAIEFPTGGGPMQRSLRTRFGVTGGHAVQVVGYDLDPLTGKIIKWKIKNSWGTNSGDEGYYHMYRDYFRAFVSGFNY